MSLLACATGFCRVVAGPRLQRVVVHELVRTLVRNVPYAHVAEVACSYREYTTNQSVQVQCRQTLHTAFPRHTQCKYG